VDPNPFANGTQGFVPHLEDGIIVPILYYIKAIQSQLIHNPYESVTSKNILLQSLEARSWNLVRNPVSNSLMSWEDPKSGTLPLVGQQI